MNPLAQLYLQAIQQQKQQNTKKIHQDLLKSAKTLFDQSNQKTSIEHLADLNSQQAPIQGKQNLEYLQKQQLLTLLWQQQQPHSNNDIDKIIQRQQTNRPESVVSVQEKMTAFLVQNLGQKEAILNINDEFGSHQMPFTIRIISNIVFYALKCQIIALQICEVNRVLGQQYQQNPLLITLNLKLWKAVSSIIRQKQVHLTRSDVSNTQAQQDNNNRFASQMLMFKEDYNELIFTALHSFQIDQGYGLVAQLSLNQLKQFLIRANDDIWSAFVYKIFNQEFQEINQFNRQHFIASFRQYTIMLNNYFKKNNLIMNVVENNVHDTKQLHNDKIFQEYLLIMGLFKGTTQEFFKKITSTFFTEDDTELMLIDFSQKTITFHKQQKSEFLYIFPALLQLENSMLDHIYSQSTRDGRLEDIKNSSNYYWKIIQKLKGKCVYNGEDTCECKKCQCIRRNRNSARESQKRKRDALEKIGPLQENYEQLEKKVHTLESENDLLRGLLIDVFKHPAVKSLSSQFIEPLTKVISAETQGQMQKKSSYLTEC